MFVSEYNQTGSGSIMLWFRQLTKQLSSGGDISTHVTGFQEAIRYLTNVLWISDISHIFSFLFSLITRYRNSMRYLSKSLLQIYLEFPRYYFLSKTPFCE